MNKIVEYVYDNLPYDIFSDRDIAQFTLQKSTDSRYGMIKRALKNNEILRIRRGLYCLSKKYQRYPLDNFSIAQLIYGPSYVSLESSLSYHGWIPEGVFMTTSVCMKRSAAYKTALGDFTYQSVPQNQFYQCVEHISSKNSSFFVAKPWKALCDYVYVHKKNWSSLDPLKNSLRIDPEMLSMTSQTELDQLIQNYRSLRINKFIRSARKDLGL